MSTKKVQAAVRHKYMVAHPLTITLSHYHTNSPQSSMQSYSRNPTADSSNFEDFEDLMTLSRSTDARKRLAALRTFCPCKVKKEVDQLWERVLEMTSDPDDGVRYQVVHTLCDGSPREREEQIIDALRSMRNDKCPKIRRAVRRALVSYDKTGKWNIL
jgi:hypothetical protein